MVEVVSRTMTEVVEEGLRMKGVEVEEVETSCSLEEGVEGAERKKKIALGHQRTRNHHRCYHHLERKTGRCCHCWRWFEAWCALGHMPREP